MIAYAESSAVLAWLLGEPDGQRVRQVLRNADQVVASPLTGVECARTLARGAGGGRITASDELAALRLLDMAERTWLTLDLSGEVLERARSPFPAEPVRALDALHLATAVAFHKALGSLTVVSLDERVRGNAAGLGMEVAP